MKHVLIPALALITIASSAVAQSPIAEVLCDRTPVLHDKLTHQFGTRQTARGVRNPEEVMEVWTGPRGDWTLVLTYSTGTSCIVAMGEKWQPMMPEPS